MAIDWNNISANDSSSQTGPSGVSRGMVARNSGVARGSVGSGGHIDWGSVNVDNANQYHQNIQNQRTYNSFSSLDPASRLKTLSMLSLMASKGNKDAANKVQLLTPHAKDDYNASQDTFAPAPTFKNGILNGLSDMATQGIYDPAVRGGAALGKMQSNSNHGRALFNNVSKKQLLADTVITGTNFAAGGGKLVTEGAAKLGSDFIGSFTAKKAVGSIAKGAALNAGLNGISTYGQGGNASDIIQSGVQGAEVGGAFGAVGAGRRALPSNQIAALRAHLNTSTAGGKLGLLNNLIDHYQSAETSAHALPSGPIAEKPLGLPAGTSVPRDATRTPGGGVMIDPNSPEARVVANANKNQLKSGTDAVPGATHPDAQGAMNQMAQEHADQHRRLDKELGGISYSKNDSGMINGRFSSNSTFYSKYYKDNGKPPTKAAYLQEAHKQLSFGTTDEARLYQATSELGQPQNGRNIDGVGAPKASGDQAKVTAAGQRLTDKKTDPNVSYEAPKATKQLDPLIKQWNNDKLTTNASKRGTIAKINTLNDIIQHPDASPEIKARATQSRHDLIHSDAKNTLAKEHSAQTGQPIGASHETLAQGHGEHGPLYQAVNDSQKTKPPGAIAQDYYGEDAKPKVNVPRDRGASITPTDQKPQRSLLEKAGEVGGVGRKMAGMFNPERAAGREGNTELAQWGQDHTARVNTRQFDALAAAEKHDALKKEH